LPYKAMVKKAPEDDGICYHGVCAYGFDRHGSDVPEPWSSAE
jgi:hypothetical protein